MLFFPMCRRLRLTVILLTALVLHVRSSAQCCDHILQMSDSYGDGWNGGTLLVTINGTALGPFAAQGSGSDTVFTVCNGDALELFYTPQDWENENSYVLFDQWGNVVFADGPTPATGLVYSGLGDCTLLPAPGSVPCAALAIDTMDCVVADNSLAPGSSLDPGCANYQGGDIWYTMPVPASGTVVISTASTGGLNDTGVALWTGPDCWDLSLVGCDDDGGSGYFSMLFASGLPVGDTLWIQAFGYGGGTGSFELCVSDPGTVTLESSELPIVMINTLGQEIPDEPKIPALMEIKYNGFGNLTQVTDPANIYQGHIGIEVRGATSSGYPQRPYGVETRDSLGENLNVPLLDMPAENDWVLLSNYNDRSLIKNQLAFHIAQGMGQYAPRTHLCEVLLDSMYQGIYLFGEKIKRDDGRVDIARITSANNFGDALTGGYILTQNYWNANNSFLSNYSPIDHPGLDIHFVYETPGPDSITVPQRTYIAAFVDSLETALYSADFADPAIGFRRYLDVPSFIHYFLVNELARNNDGFKKSVFFHKDKNSNGGKFKAGPVWDFDWAWKNIATCSIFSATDGSGWAHHINDCFTDNYSCGWYVRLLQDSTFANELRCAYEGYRTNVLDTAQLFHYIDSISDRVQNAQARHFQRWPILGVEGPAPDVGTVPATYAAEIAALKDWITLRLTWLDANIPGTCTNTAIAARPVTAPFQVFSNPTTGRVRFEGEVPGNGAAELVLRDLTGRTVQRIALRSSPFVLDVDLQGSGTYFYALERQGRAIRTGKVVVL